ncbi:MAG TPA: GerW family sporulation protein [Oscillospiraceae bacterium]|jgi:sporulation protein YtfJ|nr:GerW family sporulation protein [Oscillospiraceae bacterium]HPR39928.1 GerW family sporulation protein [Oscillospiraceae bacterium]HRW56495.1 GerW family sporulation protein [Oscillospiraceae bacterium]
MSEKNVEGLLNVSLDNLKGLVDSNSVIGSPICTPDGTTIIPVSKVSFGFASGGSDFPTTSPKDMFGGGSGGGVSINPVAFLVIKEKSVRLIQIADKDNIPERIANMVPDVIDTVSSLVKKKDKKDAKAGETVETMTAEAPAETEKTAE